MKLFVGGPYRRARGALLVLLLATAACGGQTKADEGKDAEGGGTAPAAAEGEGTTTTTRAAGKAGKKSSAAGGGATTTTTAASEAKAAGSDKQSSDPKVEEYKPRSMRTLQITAELTESCVKPGGSQTLTVRTEPDAGVAFDTEYSDYLTGTMPGHYGGNLAGYADADGTWSSTWVVAPNAPAGKATVLVLGALGKDALGETKAFFTVADALGKCA